jgi:hypothetical protein
MRKPEEREKEKVVLFFSSSLVNRKAANSNLNRSFPLYAVVDSGDTVLATEFLGFSKEKG